MTVAAGCSSAISLARLGPDSTATCAGSTPVTAVMTWLIRISVTSSMPLARLTRVAPGAKKGAQVSRLPRRFCDGTASNTVVTPSSAAAASVVARIPGGSSTSAEIIVVAPRGVHLVGHLDAPGPDPDVAARVGEHLGQRGTPSTRAHHCRSTQRAGHPVSVASRAGRMAA